MFNPQGGYSDIFIHRRLGSFFLVQNFEFQYFLGVFRKINIFGGMKILWIFFWGHHKIRLYLVVICMHFRVFSFGQGTESGIFLVAKILNIFWGA